MSPVLSNTFWNHLTDFTAASSREHISEFVGPNRSSSMVPTMTSPPCEAFGSFPQRPLPPLQSAEPLPERFTIDQPSSQIPPHSTKPKASPPPSSLPQPRRFNTVEPVDLRSASKAPSPSLSEGVWECREQENILIEFQVIRCSSRRSRSQDADDMGQCDFRIFDVHSPPARRIALRSCGNGEQCISFCEMPCIIDVLQMCSLHLSRDATGQRTCRSRK